MSFLILSFKSILNFFAGEMVITLFTHHKTVETICYKFEIPSLLAKFSFNFKQLYNKKCVILLQK